MHSGRTRLPVTGAALLLLASVLGACDHSSPFTPRDNSIDGPLIDGDPVRLTYGGAANPAWTPDGDGVVVPFAEGGRPDGDVCLAMVPAAGGTIRHLVCHVGPLTTDTVDILAMPAVAEDGRLAFVRRSRPLGTVNDRERWIAFVPWDDPAAESRVRSVPFQSSAGAQLTSIGAVRWAGDDRLIFLARGETLVAPCPTCDPILVESGRRIVSVDLGGATPQYTEIETAGNPVGVAADGNDIYFVLAGDTRVYRQTGTAGAPAVVHDFVGRTMVRDIDVAGGRLVAVTDGFAIQFDDTPDGTLIQSGPGDLYLVDLSSGSEQQLERSNLRFAAPALSPSGEEIAVAGVPVAVTELGDVAISGPADVWRFGEP